MTITAGFDVGTTTLLDELRDIARSIEHQVPNSTERRAADCIEAKDAEIGRLRAELAASQKLAAALSDEHEEVERLTAELAAAKTTHEEFRADVARLEDKIEGLETDLAESEASCDRLREAYDQIRVLNVEIANAGAASCATLRDERDAARQDAEQTKTDLASANRECDRLSNEVYLARLDAELHRTTFKREFDRAEACEKDAERLREALKLLLNETHEAGHSSRDGYGWPKALAAARAALQGATAADPAAPEGAA